MELEDKVSVVIQQKIQDASSNNTFSICDWGSFSSNFLTLKRYYSASS